MPDMTDMLNGQGGTPPAPAAAPAPAPQGDQPAPQATPDQGMPAPADGTQPPAQDQTPPPAGDQTPPPAPNADKYKDLMHNYGENVVQDMVTKYDQVQAMLQDPKQLESLTKDEIVKLYGSRDALEKQLGEILPVIQENNKNRMDGVIKGIDHPGVQNYLQELKQHLDTPEDMENVVNLVKELIPIIQGKAAGGQPPADGQPAQPVNLNDTMAGGKGDQGDLSKVDFAQAMQSPDPAVRKQAMDMMNKVLFAKKQG